MWQIRGRTVRLQRPLVMGVLNITRDSFSDGGKFLSADAAVQHAENLIAEGAGILDVGGESTRPGSSPVSASDEISRVIPVIESIAARFDIPISIDTTKGEVAEAALNAGAHIINDISGLRFDERIAAIAAEYGAGLVLMHSRGNFETMHSQTPVHDIIREVKESFSRMLKTSAACRVASEQIILDVGIGFSKTQSQNLELLAKLDKLKAEFPDHPFLVGASRKSFLGKILGGGGPDERLFGSLAAAAIAVWNGADIIRVHDVKETVRSLKVIEAIKDQL